MVERPKLTFPGGSLLAVMLGGDAPVDVRRAVQRLRAEGAPALAVDEEIAGLAPGLAAVEVAHSPGVLDALPPLFWLEMPWEDGPGENDPGEGDPAARGLRGWIVEKKPGGLAVRGFRLAPGRDALPEPEGRATVPFGAAPQSEEAEIGLVRGLVTAVSLPELMAQMGEASPVLLMPAEAPGQEAGLLRGFRLSVAVSPAALPG